MFVIIIFQHYSVVKIRLNEQFILVIHSREQDKLFIHRSTLAF